MINSAVSGIVAVLVISALIYFLLKQKAKGNGKKRSYDPQQIDRSGETKASSGVNIELVQNKWREITAMQSSGPSGLKNALSEADKLLDYVMIQKGFVGDTMGDRLKSGGSAFSNLNAIWGAHKLRNQLAHEVEVDVVADQVKQAIATLGSAIRELGVQL